MTAALASGPGSGRAPALVAYGVSIVLHLLAFALIWRIPAVQVAGHAAPVSVEIIETPPPTPAPPAPREEPAQPVPAQRTPRPARAPVARAPARPVPPTSAPPPPNAPAAEEQPSDVRIGVSMSSTTAAGTFAAPVGNTSMGQAPRKAPEPSEVKPYRADRYAPPTEVSSLPVPLRVDVPKSEYPPDALRDGFEGVVKLRLVVDEEGNVREATVVSDPGRGLGAAAVRAARRWFKFRPARKDGVAVATEIPFTVEFQLQ